MKKRLFLCSGLVLPALLWLAAAGFGEQGKKPEPKLFIPEDHYDAGKVEQGEGKVEHTFLLTNAGDAPLEIYSAESS
jgi:hypothetical protein